MRDAVLGRYQNYPTVGLYAEGSDTRENLEASGMGFGLEVEMIRIARSLDMLTCSYVFTVNEARMMAAAPERTSLWPTWDMTTSGTIAPALPCHSTTPSRGHSASTMQARRSIRTS
jgi:predicted TIM-barrel enzyme